MWIGQESFAAGEISPSLFGLVSSPQYRSGCQVLENALLTPTGAARRRHGTGWVADVTTNYPCALFFYFAKGKQFVVQFVSEDDDEGDINTTQRQVRVIDATTRAFVNFADNLPHGPFDAFGSTAAYFHHFTASELPKVYAFQDNERIYFCHPDRPTLFLERDVIEGGVERWKYGIAPPASTGPRIIDYQVQASITRPTATTLEFDLPYFDKRDEGAYWRHGGVQSPFDPNNVYGNWFKTNTYQSRTQMAGASIYGATGPDPLDWTGPYTSSSTGFTVTLQTQSTAVNQAVVVDFTPGPVAFRNWVGLPMEIDGLLFIVTAVASATQFTAVRLGGGGVLQETPATHTAVLFAIGANQNTLANQFLQQRPYLKKHPIFPSAVTGSITLTCSAGFLEDLTNGSVSWLPDGHELTFDEFQNVAIGGTIHLNSGIVALTGINTAAGPGGQEVIFTGRVLKTLAHAGPSMQWALGPSFAVGFASCGVTHQNRIYFGGFKERPTKVVASRVGSSDDFTPGANDDEGLQFTMSDPLGGRINWMESAADLLIGTATSEFAIGGRPITPTNVAVERQTGYGAKNVRPALVGSSVIFVDGGGKGIREMAFVFDSNRYQAPDLTDAAKHIFEDIEVEQLAYVSSPETIVYARDTAGLLYAFSYWRQNGVAGWSRYTQPAWPINSGASEELSTIESMCVVRADGVSVLRDELWLVRKFKAGGAAGAGSLVRRVEIMSSEFMSDQTVIDNSPTSTGMTSDTDFVGVDVQVLVNVNGSTELVYIGDYPATAALGAVAWSDLGYTPTVAKAGRQVRFRMIPVTPHITIQGEGDTQGRLERVSAALILLRESRGGRCGDGGPKTPGSLMPPGTAIPNASNPATPVPAVTEWRRALSVGVYGSLATLEITHTEPYHFEVAGLNFQMTHGK